MEKPNKQKVILDLLQNNSSVFIHLYPKYPGVDVPKQFVKDFHLILQVGYAMAIHIPDLIINDDGIFCTLSFSGIKHYCKLPWKSIFIIKGYETGGCSWGEDMPQELLSSIMNDHNKKAVADKNKSNEKPPVKRNHLRLIK